MLGDESLAEEGEEAEEEEEAAGAENAEEPEGCDAGVDPDVGYADGQADGEAGAYVAEQPIPPEEDEAELGEGEDGWSEEEKHEWGPENDDAEVDKDSYGDAEDDQPPDEDAFQEEEYCPEDPPADEDGLSNKEEDAPRPMLEKQDNGNYVVWMRQRLTGAEVVMEFCNQLQATVDELKDGEMLIFEDFDISQNRVGDELLESIFGVLADGRVRVERFRAYGCPTFNDEATAFLSAWLSGVTKRTAPFELHLSDCAITKEGFHDLMKALQESDAFPLPDPKDPTSLVPMYLRLEQNYIEDSAIQQALEDNILVAMKKGDGCPSAEIKARMRVRGDGWFQQKEGTPPAPEDVPLPKPVRAKGKGKGKGKGRDKGKGKGKVKGKGKSKGKSKSKSKSKGSDSWRGERPWDGMARDFDRDRDWRTESSGRYRDGGYRDRGQDREWRNDRDYRGYREGRGSSTGDTPPWAAHPPSKPPPTHYRDGKRLEVEMPAPLRQDRWNRSDNDRWESRSGGGQSGSRVPYNAFSKGGSNDSGWGRDNGRRTSYGSSYSPARSPARSKRSLDMDRDRNSKRYRPSSAYERSPSRPRPSSSGAGRGERLRDGDVPPHWEKHWSNSYDCWYYFHMKTGESRWEKPKY